MSSGRTTPSSTTSSRPAALRDGVAPPRPAHVAGADALASCGAFADAGPLSAKLIKNAKLKVYEGAPHGGQVTADEDVAEEASEALLLRAMDERPLRRLQQIVNK